MRFGREKKGSEDVSVARAGNEWVILFPLLEQTVRTQRLKRIEWYTEWNYVEEENGWQRGE